jgi:hypothetical protein
VTITHRKIQLENATFNQKSHVFNFKKKLEKSSFTVQWWVLVHCGLKREREREREG